MGVTWLSLRRAPTLLLEPSLHLPPAFPLTSCSSLWADFLPISHGRVQGALSFVLLYPGSFPSCLLCPSITRTACSFLPSSSPSHLLPPWPSPGLTLSAAVQPPPWPPCLQSLPTSPSLPTVHPVTQNQLFLKKLLPCSASRFPPRPSHRWDKTPARGPVCQPEPCQLRYQLWAPLPQGTLPAPRRQHPLPHLCAHTHPVLTAWNVLVHPGDLESSDSLVNESHSG